MSWKPAYIYKARGEEDPFSTDARELVADEADHASTNDLCSKSSAVPPDVWNFETSSMSQELIDGNISR